MGGPDSNVPTLNSYVSEVVLIVLCWSLILMIFLSLISTSFLIIGIGSVSIIALTSVEIEKEVFILAVDVVFFVTK